MHETAQYIRSFDLALLTETRCDDSEVFRGFQKVCLPVQDPGKAGEGTCLLVHPRLQASVSIWKLQPDVQAVWVRVDASAFALDKDLFVACVYIPPAGSAQLQPHSVSSRFSMLKEAVIMAQELGYVILGGDFNAKVAGLDDVLDADREFLEDCALSCHRGSSHPAVNLHGQLLIDLCLSTSLLLGTGRLRGDTDAPATFSRGGAGSRLDHFIMDRCTLARASLSQVHAQRYDSDHKPIVLSVPIPPAANAAAAAAAVPDQPGQPIPSLRWDGARTEKYVECMKDQACTSAIAECQRLVDTDQLEAAFHKLGATMVGAAVSAGCKRTAGSMKPGGPGRDKPYFDQECRALRSKFRYAMRHDPETVRVLARRFQTVIRRKCRQYRQQQTPALLRNLRSNRKEFWRKLNSHDGALPASLTKHSAWTAFHSNLCAPPATRLQPAACSASSAPSSPPVDALEANISQVEVERALSRLSNGKAGAQAGWPAELLRYAAYHVDLDGRRVKVWMLAPLLASLLNACFVKGKLPACISSGLVTPIHKKGCTLDPANYRPIAVGEPLYRLYTIILNARLVAWSEEHGLRSPVQAGFRPRQSAIDHLFALRHFIDKAILLRRPLFVCFVDLQKAYDTVQHELLWARLRHIGVGPRMLAAIQSLYSSGTLSMKVAGTAGPPRVQQNGVRQGCPLSPTLFGIFFDGLHSHLDSHAPCSGLQLGSGRWVSCLVYADDVALLSWSSAGLQSLLDGMHGFCQGLGLTISPTKTEVVVFNGPAPGQWHVGDHTLPQSATFKYLGIVFHESGALHDAFARLAQNGKGAVARLHAKYKKLMCNKSFPMMRRLFDAVVLPTVSYGCEVWAPASSGTHGPEFKSMLNVQIAFFRQLCHLRRSVTPPIIFREFAERPWLDTWWCRTLGFMRRLLGMPQGSLHLDILQDNIADAHQRSSCTNWAKGVERQFLGLGMGSPFTSTGIGALDSHGFMDRMVKKHCTVWAGLHESPRTAPSNGAKLCTHHRWFGRPSSFRFEPYYDLPMPITTLRALMQFKMGSHSLPVERGRFVRPVLPRHLRRCSLCNTLAAGDERHYIFDCPHVAAVRAQYSGLYQDCNGAMQSFIWHNDQKSVSHCLTAILNRIQTMNIDPSS